MKELNKNILVAMNPKSTLKYKFRNSSDAKEAARDAACTHNHAAAVAFVAMNVAHAAAVVAFKTDRCVAHLDYEFANDAFKTHLNKYFEKSKENIQDYYDEIDRINKEDKQDERIK